MSSYKLQTFDGISDSPSTNNSHDVLYSGSREKTGCRVSIKTGFILTFLAMATAAMVGVIVTFAVPKTDNNASDCNCGATQAPVQGNPDCPTVVMTTPIPSTTHCPTVTCPTCPSHEMMNQTTQTHMTPEVTSTTMEVTTTSLKMTTVSTDTTQSYRLPKSIVPTHYNVVLRPNIFTGNSSTFTTTGFVLVVINCTEETDNITMHINKIVVDNSTVVVKHENGSMIEVTNIHEIKQLHFLVIHVNPHLMPGNLYSVQMNFTGELKGDLDGLYYSSFQRNNTSRYLAITQMQPTDARKAFPCFDEPALKAKFNITLERRTDGEFSEYITLSNMPLIDSYDSTDGFTADVFAETVVMPTYLLAFAVCDYKYKNTTLGSWEFRTYARDEEVQLTNFSLEVGVDMLQQFENYFNISFVLPKLDMIAIPDFGAGAMENWGLITYRTQYMLYNPDVTTASQQRFVAIIVSHELAHMWFGNLISPEWWDDLWLNEGFASFFEYIGVNFTKPEWDVFDAFGVENIHPAFNADSLPTSRPIFATKVESPSDIGSLFDTITYQKGASVIRMMWHFLGPETLRKGLSEYIKSKEYGNVRHQDLWTALSKQASDDGKTIDVQDIMDTWILQRNYPIVKVTFDESNVYVAQKRYVIGNATDVIDSPYNYTWEIPFTFTTSVDTSYDDADVMWIEKTAKEKSFNHAYTTIMNANEWILGNVQQYGYYRVNYDDSNWRSLINQLETNFTRIHPSNRAQILNDIWALVSVNETSMTNALNTLNYLSQETSYAPWYSALGNIAYLRNMLQSKSIYGQFEAFMRKTLNDRFVDLGMTTSTDETMNNRLLRSNIIGNACRYFIPNCTTNAMSLFKNWLDNGELIPPDVKSTVICTGIRDSTSDVWNRVYNLMSSATPSDQVILLNALGCSRDHWVLNRYMEYAFDETKIRRQDVRTAVLAVAYNPLGLDVAWTYMKSNMNKILNEYALDKRTIDRIFSGISSRFNTQYRRDQMAQLQQDYTESGLSFDSSLQNIDKNIKWIADHYNTIEMWLSQKV